MPNLITNNDVAFFTKIDWDKLPAVPDLSSGKVRSLYKFLDSVDLPLVTDDETIKISNTKVFRDEYHRMEIGNSRINDPDEGRTLSVQERFETIETTQANNVVSGIGEEFHLFSLTAATFEEGCKAFCRPDVGLDKPYDACVEIVDVPAFLQLLASSADVWNQQTGNYDLPLGDLFDLVHYHPVMYEDTFRSFSGDLRDIESPSLNPYVKDSSLADQQEFRFLFRPQRLNLKPQPIIAKVPGLSKLLRKFEPSDVAQALNG